MIIIGIDVATNHKNIGISIGEYQHGTVSVMDFFTPSKEKTIAESIYPYIKGKEQILIGFDAPLGWPSKMGALLSQHHAGDDLLIKANTLFRRHTDQFIKETLNKLPLDVGADRIARTALKALNIIGELEQLTNRSIQLAWSSQINDIKVIEVYPAGTLTAYHMINSGYKQKNATKKRIEIIEFLKNHLNFHKDTDALISNDDLLDSVICLLSIKNFLTDDVYYPNNQDLANKEGWIFVKTI